jgi:hypothetical protein
MSGVNPQIGDAFYIGLLADAAADGLESGNHSAEWATQLREFTKLVELAVAYRSGELSQVRLGTSVSSSDVYSLLARATLQLPVGIRPASGLGSYRDLLASLLRGTLDAPGRSLLLAYLRAVARDSARMAEAAVVALSPEGRDGLRF